MSSFNPEMFQLGFVPFKTMAATSKSLSQECARPSIFRISQLARTEFNGATSSPSTASVVRRQQSTCSSKDRRDDSETLLQLVQSRTPVSFKFILEQVGSLRKSHYWTNLRLEPGKAQLLDCGSIHRLSRLSATASLSAILPNKAPLPVAQCSIRTPIARISAFLRRFNS